MLDKSPRFKQVSRLLLSLIVGFISITMTTQQ